MAIKKKTAGIVAGLALAGMAGAGLLATGGSAFAETTAPTPAASAITTPGTQTQGTQTKRAEQGARGAGHTHTAVTGAEAQKVIDAVRKANPGVTITTVQKDPDGTYDAEGTNADGSAARFDVSADLATIAAGGGKGGPGGGGGASQDTPVTGTQAQQVIDAVQKANAGVTITTVRQDPDGTFDALGTKADGTSVMFDVSKDLKSITENAR